MIADALVGPAEHQVCGRPPRTHDPSGWRRGVSLAATAFASLIATTAHSQLALSASATSDYRYRGGSLGSDQPALSVDVDYDVPIGGKLNGYFGGEVTVGRFPGAGLQVFDHTESIGIAGPVGKSATWDLGISNTVLATSYGGVATNYDPEVYGGLRTRFVSVYVRYSPRYFQDDVQSLYAEVDGSIPITRRWRLFAHLGALTPLAPKLAYYSTREQYDGRLGVSTLFKGVRLSAAWEFQRPGYTYYGRPIGHPDALSVTATVFF